MKQDKLFLLRARISELENKLHCIESEVKYLTDQNIHLERKLMRMTSRNNDLWNSGMKFKGGIDIFRGLNSWRLD